MLCQAFKAHGFNCLQECRHRFVRVAKSTKCNKRLTAFAVLSRWVERLAWLRCWVVCVQEIRPVPQAVRFDFGAVLSSFCGLPG